MIVDKKTHQSKFKWFFYPVTYKPVLIMSDEVNENGTTNGIVPEIELIIKVSFEQLF